MSIRQPRCLVCGARLDMGAPFEHDLRNSECCSVECFRIYMTDDDGVCHADDCEKGEPNHE